jgi:hypothetical protein
MISFVSVAYFFLTTTFSLTYGFLNISYILIFIGYFYILL